MPGAQEKRQPKLPLMAHEANSSLWFRRRTHLFLIFCLVATSQHRNTAKSENTGQQYGNQSLHRTLLVSLINDPRMSAFSALGSLLHSA